MLKKLGLGAIVGAVVGGILWRRSGAGAGGTAESFGGSPGEDAGVAGGPDDERLTEKVKSEIFRDPDVPKGQVNVNTEYGRVILRGEVESDDMVERLVSAARNVDGVSDVENLLHVGGDSNGG